MPDFQGYGWLLLDGMAMTLGVAVASMIGALIVGLAAAVGKLFAPPVGCALIEAYTSSGAYRSSFSCFSSITACRRSCGTRWQA
jgi:hypothetical protein